MIINVRRIVMGFVFIMVILMAQMTSFAAGTITVEGENSFKTSIICTTMSANSLSGGRAIVIRRSANDIPKTGCTVLYKVQAPYDGSYYMNIVCPTIGAAWISPCEIRVNDGEYEKLTAMKYEMMGTLNGTGVGDNLFNDYRLCSVTLKAGINNIYVRIPSPRQSDGQMYFYIDCLKFTPAPWGLRGFSTGVPVNVYEQKDEIKPEILFSFSDPNKHQLNIRVADYFDNTVFSENTTIESKSSYAISFKDKLSPGHYTVHVSGEDIEESEYYFSVVENYDERSAGVNTHFMVDAAGIYLIDPDKIGDYARSMRLAGVTSARERFRWTTYQKSSNEIDMTLFDNYQKAYEENGIHTMALNESAPAFMKNDAHFYPENLVEAYKFAKFMTERYGTMVDVEAWNEPDAKDEPADYLASFVKAMAIGQKDGNPNSVSIGPGLCVSPSLYADSFLQSQVMNYLDAWSFHSHITSANGSKLFYEIPGVVDLFMDTIKRYGFDENKYYYLTEAGISLLPDPDVKASKQRIQARYCATSMLQSAAKGIDRHYWFVYPYYKEGDLWWGNFTSDGMPQSSYSALAAMTEAVGEAKYLGNLNVGDGVNCLVFKDMEQQVAAIWSEKETEIQLLLNEEATLTNIMGEKTTITPTNGIVTIKSSPDVQYVRQDSGFGEYKNEDYVEKTVAKKTFTKAERIILQQNFPAETLTGSKNGGYVVPKSEPTTVTLSVTNLNDTEISAIVNGKTYGDWSLTPSSQNVSVAPYSSKSVTFELKAGAQSISGVSTPIVFSGTSGGEELSRSVSTFVTPVDENIEPDYTLNGYDNPELWKRNMTAGATEERTSANGVLDIKYVFDVGDKWVYPKFNLTGDNLSGSAGLVYEAYFDKVPDGLTLRAFAYENNGAVYFTDAGVKSAKLKSGWNKIIIPWAEFVWQGGLTDFNFNLDPDEIYGLSVGLNSSNEKNIHYKIRNLGVYKQPDAKIYAKIQSLSAVKSEDNVDINAVLLENQTGIDEKTIVLKIDGKKYEWEFDGTNVHLKTPISVGAHEIELSFMDKIGKSIFTKITYEQ